MKLFLTLKLIRIKHHLDGVLTELLRRVQLEINTLINQLLIQRKEVLQTPLDIESNVNHTQNYPKTFYIRQLARKQFDFV